jgi:hypothetical protein
MNLDHAQN